MKTRRYIDLTDWKFNYLTCIKYIRNNKFGSAIWLVKCDCGKKLEVRAANLKNGNTKSCGCHNRDLCSKLSIKNSIPKCIEDTLFYNYPDLMYEWDFTKNSRFNPSNFKIGSNKKMWWLCSKCGYSWTSTISKRTLDNRGCPICRESHGEKIVSKILQTLNIYYEREKRFNDCRNIRPLPFDFYLPDYNLCIEYQGQQHYKPFNFKHHNIDEITIKKFNELKYRDNLKIEYCFKNNIKLIIVPFYMKYNEIVLLIKNSIGEIL